MFQFQGGISDLYKERIFSELQRARYSDVGKNGRIHYRRHAVIRIESCTTCSSPSAHALTEFRWLPATVALGFSAVKPQLKTTPTKR